MWEIIGTTKDLTRSYYITNLKQKLQSLEILTYYYYFFL